MPTCVSGNKELRACEDNSQPIIGSRHNNKVFSAAVQVFLRPRPGLRPHKRTRSPNHPSLSTKAKSETKYCLSIEKSQLKY